MPQKLLTTEELEKLKPNEIFLWGIVLAHPLGLNVGKSGAPIRWVACKRTWDGWSIFWRDEPALGESLSNEEKNQYVRENGALLSWAYEHAIGRLVPHEADVWKRYSGF